MGVHTTPTSWIIEALGVYIFENQLVATTRMLQNRCPRRRPLGKCVIIGSDILFTPHIPYKTVSAETDGKRKKTSVIPPPAIFFAMTGIS